MSSKDILETVRLAEASYSDLLELNTSGNDIDYIRRLSNSTTDDDDFIGLFSHDNNAGGLGASGQSEALRFADDYRVVHQYDGDINETANLGYENGFSATLFESVDGKLTLGS